MKNRLFWKMTLCIGLSVLLLLPPTNLAKSKFDSPYVPASLIKIELKAVTEYTNELSKYATDCDSLKDSSRLSGEKLKQCLTILKGLRDKFGGFRKNSESVISKIKNANKWTKEFDDDFEKNAVKRGGDAASVNEVKNAGGLREFFQKIVRDFDKDKRDLDTEIKELEAMLEKSASSQSQPFQRISYTSPAVRGVGDYLVRKIRQMAKALCLAVCCACEPS